MAMWGNLPTKIEPEKTIKLGGGINTYIPPFDIDRGQQVSNLNVSSVKYPALSVRLGSAVTYNTTLTSGTSEINSLGTYSGTYLLFHQSTNLRYYATSTGYANLSSTFGILNTASKMIEFNRASDRLIFFTDGTNRCTWNGSTANSLSYTTQAPATKLYTVDDFRLYALDGSIIKYCSAGDPTDWTTVDDAGQEVVTGMIGTGTSISTYNDMVIAWSDQTMHILYGNSPDDFELRDPIPVGNISDRGTIKHMSNEGEVLYWMDYGRVMAFTGGSPFEIGQNVKSYLDGINYNYKSRIVAMKNKKWVYWSIPYNTTSEINTVTLEYDTEFKVWNVYNIGIIDTANIGESLITANELGYLTNSFDSSYTDDTGVEISWEAITGVYNHTPMKHKKTISDIYAVVDLSTTSTMTIAYSTIVSGGTYTTLKTVSGTSEEQSLRIQIPTSDLARVDYYRLKFSGTGQCIIHGIEPYIRINR